MRLSRLPSLGAIALLGLLIVALLSGGDDGSAPDGESEGEATGGNRVRAPVVDVVDGDTIEVLVDGAEEDLRYIGVDTPESVAPGQPVECFGREASELNRRLVEGETVRVVFDAERRDHYGRLLAYVFVGPTFVNAELVRRGYATTLTIPPNDSRAALFDRLEQQAGNEGLGLWSVC